MTTSHPDIAADKVAKARQVQMDRENENLANHRSRLMWLNEARPRWSCGRPIDAHMRQVLRLQSEAAIAFSSPISALDAPKDQS